VSDQQQQQQHSLVALYAGIDYCLDEWMPANGYSPRNLPSTSTQPFIPPG